MVRTKPGGLPDGGPHEPQPHVDLQSPDAGVSGLSEVTRWGRGRAAVSGKRMAMHGPGHGPGPGHGFHCPPPAPFSSFSILPGDYCEYCDFAAACRYTHDLTARRARTDPATKLLKVLRTLKVAKPEAAVSPTGSDGCATGEILGA